MSNGPLPDPMLRWFRYEHLPEHLRVTSKRFSELAWDLVRSLPQGSERRQALRKLLESKDCAVRAKIDGAAGD